MNLFINTYEDKNPERNQELQECLERNKALDIYVYEIQGRPTFKDIFNIINSITDTNSINIVANSDIYFDNDSLEEIKWRLKESDQCFALSRWDVQPDGSAVHYNNSGSQDTWIFRGAIKMVEGANFTQGIAGCDNKIAYLLQQAGYNVTNPSLSIKTYHLHLSNVRSYDRGKDGRPARKVYRLPHPRINVTIS